MAQGRRGFIVLAGLSFLAGGRAFAVGIDQVATPIASLQQGLLTVMKAGKSTPFEQRYNLLAPIIERVFDVPQILRASVGLTWSSIPPQQQQALLQVFQRYTVATFVSNFDSYNGQRFNISPQLRTVGNDVVVDTQLVSTDGTVHRLDYVMRQEGYSWKVVDVLSDGSISQVATQRSDFVSVLRQGGAPALIARLQQKVANLSGG